MFITAIRDCTHATMGLTVAVAIFIRDNTLSDLQIVNLSLGASVLYVRFSMFIKSPVIQKEYIPSSRVTFLRNITCVMCSLRSK